MYCYKIHLNTCFQQSAAWLAVSKAVVMTTSILSTWAAWSLTSLALTPDPLTWPLTSDAAIALKSSLTQEVRAS